MRNAKTAALVASLCLNLFCLGWAASFFLRPGGPPPFGFFSHLDQRLSSSLSAEGYQRMKTLLADFSARDPAKDEREFVTMRDKIAAMIGASSFDKAAFLALAQQLNRDKFTREGEMVERIASTVADLSAEDRAALAVIVRSAPPPPPPPPGGPGGPPPR